MSEGAPDNIIQFPESPEALANAHREKQAEVDDQISVLGDQLKVAHRFLSAAQDAEVTDVRRIQTLKSEIESINEQMGILRNQIIEEGGHAGHFEEKARMLEAANQRRMSQHEDARGAFELHSIPKNPGSKD